MGKKMLMLTDGIYSEIRKTILEARQPSTLLWYRPTGTLGVSSWSMSRKGRNGLSTARAC